MLKTVLIQAVNPCLSSLPQCQLGTRRDQHTSSCFHAEPCRATAEGGKKKIHGHCLKCGVEDPKKTQISKWPSNTLTPPHTHTRGCSGLFLCYSECLFLGVGMERFHCIQRCPHFRGLE